MDVVPIIQDYSFNITPGTTTATRAYVDASVLPNDTFVQLPSIGQYWDTTWPGLYANEIKVTYLNDNDLCAKKYVVNYSTATVNYDNNKLPASLQIESEYFTYRQTLTDNASSWNYQWEDKARVTEIEFHKRIPVENYTLYRRVNPSTFTDYLSTVINQVGTINNAAWRNIPKGCALFTGAQMDQKIGADQSKIWTCQLRISVKAINWIDDNGWNMQWNSNTKNWEIPTRNGQPLYLGSDFDILLNHSSTPTAIFPSIPNS